MATRTSISRTDALAAATPPTGEELLPKPLAEFIRDLGLAVAAANKALSEATPDAPQVYVINSADIEVAVAIAVQKTTEAGGEVKLGLGAFSLNASYKSTFGFKEEASSKIKISLATRPRGA